MNLLKSFIVGNIVSWFPTVILSFLNYKYDNETRHGSIFEIYSFYLFDLLLLILFYILNYRKNKLKKIKYNNKLILLCVLSFTITYISWFITYFTTKNFILENNEKMILEIDSLEEKDFENVKNSLQEYKNIDFIGILLESIFGKIITYYISSYFYNESKK